MEPCPTILSAEQCKDLLRLIAKKHCVKASLISTRLLNDEAKEDMLNAEFPMDSLEAHVKAWMDAGMPDYAHGFTDPMEKKQTERRIKPVE